ncbi:MAG: NarK/NasA family nitrate transporter [candidate division Zixibacteria bacterium]|nr:NarK/NasA family nitrate transporter [candidate division Zixibacteria bacterium]
MSDKSKAISVLTLNTLAFTVCFACWMVNGVLVTFLVDNNVYAWDKVQMGWLIGIPVLTGSLFRLPVGILTDKYGGRIVYTAVMLLSALPMYLLSQASSFWTFFTASLGFGIAGTSFAVGIAYTSVWFKKERQGTALGIFGAGNAGAALTSMGAPIILRWLTDNGNNLDAWRAMPKLYACGLVVMALIFWFLTHTKITDNSHINSFMQRLEPLKHLRVWRFGIYYFLVFGGFVALAQWLIPYYVNVYTMSVASAGLMAAIFSLPSGLVRALGGYLSDKWGARRVMYIVLGCCLICCVFLVVPRMDIESPGKGIMSTRAGMVVSVTDYEVVVDSVRYELKSINGQTLTDEQREKGTLVWPTSRWWQEPVVKAGDTVQKKQLLARGVTHIYFQANIWVFTGLVFVVGFMMGIGKAAVYKHIPDYFPRDVGVVGGIVGVLGGLGGFFCPILFGYLLEGTGLWTTCWMFFAILTGVCLWWMHAVIQRMLRKEMPEIATQFETVRKNGK